MKKWVKALRSGSYRQTTGRLALRKKERFNYCCLGVLGQIAANEGLIKSKILETGTNDFKQKSYDGIGNVLPDSVKNWAGMKDNHGGITINGIPVTLIKLNDSGHYSFKQIADVVEKNYKKL